MNIEKIMNTSNAIHFMCNNNDRYRCDVTYDVNKQRDLYPKTALLNELSATGTKERNVALSYSL